MPEELYARQETLRLSIPRHVTIAGCGGIGFWAATFSAMSGVPNLYLFDPDTLEESNRNRLPVCQGALNRPKVDVVREFILPMRPDAVIVAMQEKLEGIFLDIQLGVSQFLIDCTDSPRAQHFLYNSCVGEGVNYIRSGYDGTHITITSNVSGWVRNDVEEEQYTINPSWVVPAVVAASLAVGKMLKYGSQEVSLDLSEIGIPAIQRQRRLTARCRQPGR